MSAATAESPAGLAASIADVRAAAKRLEGHIHITPVLTCNTLDRLSGCNLFFKCEQFQKGGAFKARGALNAVLSLPEASKGVVTHSSGNHAGAVALAAQLRGIPAHIVVPENAPGCKIDAVRQYGGQLVLCKPTLADREATCAELAATTGATFIPPYDSASVIAGQGTVGLELLQQVPQLDVVVVPVSGGGLLSGVAIAAKALKPGGIKVIAAEPCGLNNAADVAASKAAGRLIHDMPKPVTVADGLQAKLGQHTWPIVQQLVDAVVVVKEDEMLAAMKLLFERMKLVVEPSGAAGLAAVLAEGFKLAVAGLPAAPLTAGPDSKQQRMNVGVVLSGGNIDFCAKGFWDAANWQPAG